MPAGSSVVARLGPGATLPHVQWRAMAVDTPLGWGGGPAETPPWRPEVCVPRTAVLPSLGLLGGIRRGWGNTQGFWEGLGSRGYWWEVPRCEPQTSEAQARL